MRILVAIPTYNEKYNVPIIYQKIRAITQPLDILFIDDHSPDNTRAAIELLQIHDKNVYALHRTGKLGLGTAQKAAFEYARQHAYDFLIIMDAVLTHDPKYIPDMLKLAITHDIVIGSRYAGNAQMHGWGSFRLVLTHFWRFMIKYCLGLPYDSTGAYRVYRVSALHPEIYNQVKGTGFAFGMENLYRFAQHGARIAQVPIQAHSRIHGDSKLSGKVMREVAARFTALTGDRIAVKLGLKKIK